MEKEKKAKNLQDTLAAFQILDDLIRLVVRSFYGDLETVLISILTKEHRAISESEFEQKTLLKPKQFRKGLNLLADHHLIKIEGRKKKKFDSQGNKIKTKKWENQTFYYIDYKHMVDVVKFRWYKMNKVLTDKLDQQIQMQQYQCRKCDRKFNDLDALNLFDPQSGEFKCERCKTPLVAMDNSRAVNEIKDKQRQMLNSLKQLTEQLKLTEGITIPKIVITHEDTNLPEDEITTRRQFKESEISVVFENEENNLAPQEPTSTNLDSEVKTSKAPVPWSQRKLVSESAPEIAPVVVTASIQSPPMAKRTTKEDLLAKNDYLRWLQENQQSEELVQEASNQEVEEEVFVKVAGQLVPFSQVTEEHTKIMSESELQEFSELYQKLV